MRSAPTTSRRRPTTRSSLTPSPSCSEASTTPRSCRRDHSSTRPSSSHPRVMPGIRDVMRHILCPGSSASCIPLQIAPKWWSLHGIFPVEKILQCLQVALPKIIVYYLLCFSFTSVPDPCALCEKVQSEEWKTPKVIDKICTFSVIKTVYYLGVWPHVWLVHNGLEVYFHQVSLFKFVWILMRQKTTSYKTPYFAVFQLLGAGIYHLKVILVKLLYLECIY